MGLLVLLGSLVLLPGPGHRALAQAPGPASKARGPESVPLVFEGERIGAATGSAGAFSAAERAVAIVQRLERIRDHSDVDPAMIAVKEVRDGTEILVEVKELADAGDGDTLVAEHKIMVITDEDAAAAGVGRRALAEDYRGRFRRAIEAARIRHSFATFALGIVKTILATLLLVVGLALIRVVRRSFLRSLETAQARVAADESLVTVLVHTLCVLLSLLVRLLVWPAIGLLFLTYLHFVLHFFPSTTPLANTLHRSVLRMLRMAFERVVAYSPNLVVIAVILVVTRYLLKVASTVLDAFDSGRLRLAGFYPEWARPTYRILRFVVIALMLVVLYPYLPGSDSAVFRGISVFVGLLLSLGSTSVVANVMAGTIQTYMRSMQAGDFVQIGDHTGTVVDKTLLVTRIRTVKNVIVTIPNSTTLTTPVKNFSVKAREEGVLLYTSVTLAHDVPWRDVQAHLIAAARGVAGVREEPRPFVLQTALGEASVRYELNAYSDQPARQSAILTALHQNIQDRLRADGIQVLVPTYVTLRDGHGSGHVAGTGRGDVGRLAAAIADDGHDGAGPTV
jgi:small-conductance mechanosensitive channel